MNQRQAWNLLHGKYQRLLAQHEQKIAALPDDLEQEPIVIPAPYCILFWRGQRQVARDGTVFYGGAETCMTCGRKKDIVAFCPKCFAKLDASTRKSFAHAKTQQEMAHAWNRGFRLLTESGQTHPKYGDPHFILTLWTHGITPDGKPVQRP
jgi:hypothetical protein